MTFRSSLARCCLILAVVVGACVFEVILADLAPDPCPMRATTDSARLPGQSTLSTVGRADAVPAFARRYNMTCTHCHTAFPYLNEVGRHFKESGYLMVQPGEKVEPAMQGIQQTSENLWLNKRFPLAIAFDSLPFEKVTNEDAHTAPLDSIETFVAGNFFTLGSAFVSVEFAKDEDFSPEVHGWLGYHPTRYVNVLLGRGSVFAADPYNTINGRSLTQAGEGEARDAILTVYGRASKVYYAAGFNSSPEGNLDQDRMGNARVAVDIVPQLTAGVFGILGKRTSADIIRWTGPSAEVEAGAGAGTPESADYARGGADITLDLADLHLLGVFAIDRSDPDNADSETNLQGYGLLYYTLELADRPILVPVFRVNYGQSNDGADDTVTLVGNVSSYLLANMRLGAEVSTDLTTPPGIEDETRVAVFGSALW